MVRVRFPSSPPELDQLQLSSESWSFSFLQRSFTGYAARSLGVARPRVLTQNNR